MNIKINSDISKYKASVFGLISFRNFLVILVMLAVGGVVYYLTYQYLIETFVAFLIILAELPVALFYLDEIPLFSLPAEKVAKVVLLDLISPHRSKSISAHYTSNNKEGDKYSMFTKHKYKVPVSIQDFIPNDAFYEDGISSNGNWYSAVYQFTDIDFSNLSDADKDHILQQYESLLGSFTDEAFYKLTIVNSNQTAAEVFKKIELPECTTDKRISRDLNQLKWDVCKAHIQLQSDLYITISVFKSSINDARSFFASCLLNLSERLSEMDSQVKQLSLNERIRLYHGIYNSEDPKSYVFSSLREIKGNDLRDYCCPHQWSKKPDYIKINDIYFRTLYIQAIGKSIPDDFFKSISCKIPKLSISTIEVKPISDQETQRIINLTVTQSRRKINKYKEDKAKKFIIDDYLPPTLAQENESSVKIYKDITERDQRLYACTILLVITAASKDELDDSTRIIKEESRSKNIVFEPLYNQQVQGLFETIPFGINNTIEIKRTMTTESIAAFIPFSSQAIQTFGKKSTWIGINPDTGKVNSIDRSNLLNGNGLVYGVSGSGKSVQAKIEITEHRIKEYENADILIIDPNGEYSDIAKALGGISVDISVGSADHINLMDLNRFYGSDNESNKRDPVKSKISFLQHVISLMCDGEISNTLIRPIIDRCATKLYKPYVKSSYQGKCPTLQDLYNEIKNQPEDIAQTIALAIESFAFGSLDIFAQETNTPPDNGLCVYNLKDLDDSFMVFGHLIMIDQIINRISNNLKSGRWTYVYIDEIHTFFGTPAEPLIMRLWKMGRKNHCFSTGITQQIQDLLEYENGQKIIGNSEFVQILKCDELQLAEALQRTLSIPPSLMKYIRGEKNPTERIRKSTGIIKYAGTVIPFESKIPEESFFYSLINTD